MEIKKTSNVIVFKLSYTPVIFDISKYRKLKCVSNTLAKVVPFKSKVDNKGKTK